MNASSHPTRIGGGTTLHADVVVVGAGVAGLVAALDVLALRPDTAIVVIDKGAPGSAGSTPLAQGGLAAAVGADDSPAAHAADTLRASDGLGDARAAAVVAAEAPARVDDLVRRGVRFDRGKDGTLDLAREGGQVVARSVRAADATGAEIFRALREAATGRITRLQGTACALALDKRDPARAVCGVWTLLDATDANPAGPGQEQGLALVRAGAVVLASGGCGGLYAATTNRDGACGDGVALALEAGAALVDLEFVQFHPTGLKAPVPGRPFSRFLITEALRGAGATLLDAQGHRFMVDRHPDAELAPRHIVTRGIIEEPGGVWLDASHLGREQLRAEFPTVLAGAARAGFDLTREPVPVEPVQHYMIGGVATDLWGATTVPGLYAAGEVACPGVHGANRLAGNSLAQSCVFAHRAAARIAAALSTDESRFTTASSMAVDPEPPPQGTHADAAADPGELRGRVRRMLSEHAGPIRTAQSLARAAAELDDAAARLPATRTEDQESVEITSLVTVARLIVSAATRRTESRGVHWRDDFPKRDPQWDGLRLRIQTGI